MASFNVNKGSKFSVNKSIQNIRIGVGWNESKVTKPIDIDSHVFGCIAGSPRFYNEGSHALTYANSDLVKSPDKSFRTADGSMIHSGDNLTGSGPGDDETITVHLDKLPNEVGDLHIFITIHDAKARQQHFGLIDESHVAIYNADTGEELCRYNLKSEFDGLINIHVGSVSRGDNGWTFAALGEGSSDEGLEDILAKLS